MATDPSKCDHTWIKGQAPLHTELCMWCGIPKIRKTGAPPKLPMPKPERLPFNRARK